VPRRFLPIDVNPLAPPDLRQALLAHTEKLIGRCEQNLTRASIQLTRHLAAGWPSQDARDLLLRSVALSGRL
jgi:hypothetical protein